LTRGQEGTPRCWPLRSTHFTEGEYAMNGFWRQSMRLRLQRALPALLSFQAPRERKFQRSVFEPISFCESRNFRTEFMMNDAPKKEAQEKQVLLPTMVAILALIHAPGARS
jgi:hypothetical protein